MYLWICEGRALNRRCIGQQVIRHEPGSFVLFIVLARLDAYMHVINVRDKNMLESELLTPS